MITYLIGGGPSAADLDTDALPKGFRIGVNDAAFHKPCDIFFTNDHGYALGIRGKIESFPGPRHLSIRHRHMPLFKDWDATVWQRMASNEPVLKAGQLSSGDHGVPGCSGYVAMNLAVQLGATKIILFGYDFAPVYTYFFNDDPYPRVRIPEVIASFRKIAPWYARKGIDIYNANPNSNIDVFQKITHEEARLIT